MAAGLGLLTSPLPPQMDFPTSTHRRSWLFTKEQLEAKRRSNLERCKEEVTRRQHAADPHDPSAGSATKRARVELPPDFTVEDEQAILRFYQCSLHHLCTAELKLPQKIYVAASMYYKRFYLNNTTLEHPPAMLMLTAIFLACKIEEHYTSAEKIAGAVNKEVTKITRLEMPLLQGLNFDLLVHSPHRALQGLMQDLRAAVAAKRPELGEALLAAPEVMLARDVPAKAAGALEALLLSDAPLVYPPAQVALAALRSGLRSRGFTLTQPYLARLVAEGQKLHTAAAAGQVGRDGSTDVSQLVKVLDELDAYGADGSKKPEQEDVLEPNKRLNAWRNLLKASPKDAGDGGGGGKGDTDTTAAAAAAASRAAKAQRRAAEEAALLGMPQRPAQQPEAGAADTAMADGSAAGP